DRIEPCRELLQHRRPPSRAATRHPPDPTTQCPQPCEESAFVLPSWLDPSGNQNVPHVQAENVSHAEAWSAPHLKHRGSLQFFDPDTSVFHLAASGFEADGA